MKNSDPRKKAIISLKKSQSHISKVLKMIDDDVYCIKIIEQIMAVNGLLRSASEKILQDHMRTCFMEGMSTTDGEHKEKMINEVLNVMSMSGRHK